MQFYTLKVGYEGSTSVFDYAEEIDAEDDAAAILMAKGSLRSVILRMTWSVAILVDEDGDEVWRQTRGDTVP